MCTLLCVEKKEEEEKEKIKVNYDYLFFFHPPFGTDFPWGKDQIP